jgi:hypothetical protein
MQRRGLQQRADVLGAQPQPFGDCPAQARHVVQVHAELRRALGQHFQQRVHGLAAGRRAAEVLLRVHAPVCDAQRRGRVSGTLVREQDPSARRTDKKAVTLVRQRLESTIHRLGSLVRSHGRQHAELVAAHPVALAPARHGGREPVPEPFQ